MVVRSHFWVPNTKNCRFFLGGRGDVFARFQHSFFGIKHYSHKHPRYSENQGFQLSADHPGLKFCMPVGNRRPSRLWRHKVATIYLSDMLEGSHPNFMKGNYHRVYLTFNIWLSSVPKPVPPSDFHNLRLQAIFPPFCCFTSLNGFLTQRPEKKNKLRIMVGLDFRTATGLVPMTHPRDWHDYGCVMGLAAPVLVAMVSPMLPLSFKIKSVPKSWSHRECMFILVFQVLKHGCFKFNCFFLLCVNFQSISNFSN